MNKVLLSLLLTLSVVVGRAQFELVFSSDTVATSGGTVDIDVSVNGFTDIIAAGFSINWDASVLNFASVENINTDLPEFSVDNFGTPSGGTGVDPGEIVFLWSRQSTAPASIDNGARLFTLRFNLVGDVCSSTQVTISDTPRRIDVIDADINSVDVTSRGGQFAIYDATTCTDGGGGNNGNDQLTITLDNVTGNQGNTICIPVRVDNFTDIESFASGVQWDPSVLSFTEVRNGELNMVINDQNAAQGNINVLWTFDQMAETVPDGATIFELCFEVVGSTQQTSSVQLVSLASFAIEISGLSGEITDYVINNSIVTVSSGGGAMNGVGLGLPTINTLGASNICVPVTASDFERIAAIQTGISYDSTVVRFTGINDGALSDVSVGGGVAGDRPLRLLWTADFSTPSVTLADNTVLFELCFDVIGGLNSASPIGFVNLPNFRIELSNEEGNATEFFTSDGRITVTEENTGGGGNLTLDVGSVTIPRGQTGCVPITATNFTNIGGLGYAMQWDQSVLRYVDTRAHNLATLGTSSFTFTANDNLLNMVWTPTTAQSVADGTVIYEVCFEAVDPCGPLRSTGVAIVDGRTPIQIIDDNGGLITDASLNSGTVTVSQCDDGGTGVFSVRLNSFSNPTCGGAANGTINVEFEEASGSVSCLWVDNSTNLAITAACNPTGLPAGSYTLTSTDQAGRQTTLSVTLADPAMMGLSTSVSNASCTTGGQISASVTGGTPPYRYQWSGGLPDQAVVTDLPAGTYALTVIDASGCTVSDNEIFIENVSFEINATITDATDEDNPNGMIELNTSNGNLTYSWSNGANTQTISGLAPGTYTVMVTDNASNCTQEFSYEVGANFTTTLSIDDIVNTAISRYNGFGVSCFGESDGVLDGAISGACTTADNIITLNGVTVTFPVENLMAGDYTLRVDDGCGNVVEESFTLEEPDAISLNGVTNIVCPVDGQGGVVELSLSGGTSPYSLTPSIGSAGTGTRIEGLSYDTYTVVVTDANGCQMMLADLMIDEDDCDVVPPPPGPCPAQTIISPNGDNVNDTFTVGCADTTVPNTLTIYDRWGNLVMQSANYTNDWDGTDLDGEALPEGGYMWVFETGGPGNRDLFRGTVSILR